MKVLRKILAVLCAGFFALTASSCWFWGGYNGIMYNYFQEEENYLELTMTLLDFSWVDWDNAADERVPYSLYKNSTVHDYKEIESDFEECSFYMGLSYVEGDLKGWEWIAGENIAFRLCPQNAREIIKNGVLENVALGDVVTIRGTMWIYSDTNFFELAALESSSVSYLDFNVGLQNYKEYMDENRSLL